MNIWTDGLTVLVDQAWTVFSILITVIWGHVLIVILLKKTFKNQFTNAEYFSLGMAGWILPTALLSLALFMGTFLFGGIAATVISVFTLVALICILFVWRSGQISLWPDSALVFLLLAVSVILQLAFLKKTILPLYFDSAEHYRIIKYFVDYFELPGNGLFLINYYHVGYHFFSATTAYVFHLGIVDTMLVFGQLILGVLPFSLFFIVKQETRSNVAAIFTCLLAEFGWHMPSHAVNWGKYPALFSLVGIHFVLSIGYLIFICYLKSESLSDSEGSLRAKIRDSSVVKNAPSERHDIFEMNTRNNKPKAKRLILYLLLGFGVLISTLIHTRSLIVFAFMGISMLLTLWWERLALISQRLIFAFGLCLLAVQIAVMQGNAALAPLFGVYVGQDLFATGLVILLLIFSAQAFSDLTFFLLVLLSMMLAGLYIPISGVAGYGTLTLLDRPYVQMLLYLPLSISGGLGLAGLHKYLQRFSFRPKLLTQLATFSAFVFVILNATVHHNFYPSGCCQIVSRDDLAALEWMDKTLPSDANVLIASTDLFVTSFDATETQAGMDGGVWIPPLTSRKTTFMKGDLNFEQTQIRAEVCRLGANYIYAGGMPLSFKALLLDGQPNWYQIVFSLPDAKVYKVIGCG